MQPLFIIFFLIFIIGGIALVVIVGLTPFYLKKRDVTVYRPSAGTDNICYLDM